MKPGSIVLDKVETSSVGTELGSDLISSKELSEVVRLRVSIGGNFVQVRIHFSQVAIVLPIASLVDAFMAPLPSYSSRMQKEGCMWKYVGGQTFLETAPVSWRYTDMVFSLSEKVDGAISLKYQLPGEDLDPDSLISIADDGDMKV